MRPFCRIRVPGSRLSHTSVSVHFIIALKKCLADQTKRMSLAAVLSWQLGTQMVSLATDGPQDVIGSSRCHLLSTSYEKPFSHSWPRHSQRHNCQQSQQKRLRWQRSQQSKGTVGKGTVKGTGRDAETLQLLPEAVC